METDVTQAGHWDAICVGAGITSLAFGAQVVARHPGARILVIDKHSAAGGYATQFSRPKAGALFDCSLHKLTGTRETGNLRRMFREMGLDQELEMLSHPDHFEACLLGEGLVLGNSPAIVKQKLLERFPAEADGLHRFFAEVEVHGRNSYYQFQILSGEYEVDFAQLRLAHRQLKPISVAEAMAQRFSDGLLQEILAAPSIYVGGFPEELSYLYFLHVVYASLYLGNAYISGRSQRLSDVLAARICAAGGEVMLSTTVTDIVPGVDGTAHRVVTLRGNFTADRLYINAAPQHAMARLLPPLEALAPARERLKNLKPSRATTTLYLTTDADPGTLGLHSVETMIFEVPQHEGIAARARSDAQPADAELAELAFWRLSPVEVTNYHALDGSGGRVVCMNVLDTIAHWPERRSKDYKEKKRRAIEVLLARLLAAKPGLAGHILHTELATPRTYQRYTNNTDGAGFGALVGTNAVAHVFHHGFPFKGIHFLSAWVSGAGYEATFGYAEMKSREWPGAGLHPLPPAPPVRSSMKELL